MEKEIKRNREERWPVKSERENKKKLRLRKRRERVYEEKGMTC